MPNTHLQLLTHFHRIFVKSRQSFCEILELLTKKKIEKPLILLGQTGKKKLALCVIECLKLIITCVGKQNIDTIFPEKFCFVVSFMVKTKGMEGGKQFGTSCYE